MIADVMSRWPHIAPFLEEWGDGKMRYDYLSFWYQESELEPAEQAMANEEWADFFEFLLEQRADELAGDRVKRHLVEEWTDSMVYGCRRAAVIARGGNPGPWVPLPERRPDLAATGRAIVETIAG